MMPDKMQQNQEVSPTTIRRRGGGWLAVSPNGATVSIGVTAKTEEDAIQGFCVAFRRWLEILDTKT